MSYTLKTTRLFDYRLKNLQRLFQLDESDTREVTQEIKYIMAELLVHGKVPDEYLDHELTDEPWIGFRELHILDDLLVVYFKVDKKKRIRMTTITNHLELRSGTLR